jgi:RNA polymerase sigma-70 factor, ECF subfamily
MTKPVADLLRRILAREEAALLDLYSQFGGLVYSIALRVIDDPALAEEVTQDVFMKVWDKIGQFDETQASFPTWLSRIARNAAIDSLRKASNRKVTQSLDEQPQQFEETLASQYEDDPARHIALHSALLSLPPEQAELIRLAYFGGMSHQDIADHTGLPLGTIKSRIRAGLQKLRDVWEINPIAE